MKSLFSPFSLSLISTAVVLLTACGGGGSGTGTSGETGSTPTAPTTATSSVTTTVMDGLITNALVCLDVNNNSLCDVGETQGRTDASGQVTLTVKTADLTNARLIAVVSTDATDADTGAVKTPYTLTTPQGRNAVISPLTTMAHTLMKNNKLSSTEADAQVQLQTGLTVTVYDNFIAKRGQNSAYQKAGEVARLWVVSAQKSEAAVAASGTERCGLESGEYHDRLNTNLANRSGSFKVATESNDDDNDDDDNNNSIRKSCTASGISGKCDRSIENRALILSCSTLAPTPTPTPTPSPAPTPAPGTTPTPSPAPAPTPTPTPTPAPAPAPAPGTTPAPTPTPTTSASNGKVIYVASCAMCHSQSAAANVSKVLKGANSPSTILNAITKNTGGMGFLSSSIGAQQAADLAAFLATPGI